MSPTQDAYRWIDQHDDRLTRLEDQSRETNAQLAANTVQLESLAAEVTQGFNKIATKLDAMATIPTRVEALEASRKDRRSWIGNVVTGVIVGVLVLISKALAGL
jgi:hypothetical protein